jgi:asparagine synthase (glutamine-hydrolysing)
MCGISGFVPFKLTPEEAGQVVDRMNARLAHRGPDNTGRWRDGATCLGHTRLSIIDLSEQSNQPFRSEDGRYVIVYNGELYNYRELRLLLQRATHGSNEQPYFFKTQSDTEVVLAAFIRWGNNCLSRFNGMFAFAIYDTTEKKLFIARDRMGVKPLYYYYGDQGLAFASEIRAIIHSGIKRFSLNLSALPEYLMYQTVFAPATMVKGISMLLPGHFLEYTGGKAAVTRYYDLHAIAPAETSPYDKICDKVLSLLTASVERRLIADVPFGAFLSGGIDSSAVVALMSRVSTEKVNTFNVSFDESDFSEARYARLIAKKYNTRHHEISLRPEDFLSRLPDALAAMDHPSGDGPNTYVVSRATKEAGITMALSGIGGDELFAGYDIFRRMASLQKRSWVNAVPHVLRSTAAAFIGARKNVGSLKTAELLREKELSFVSAYKYSRSVFSKKQLLELVPGSLPYQRVDQILSAIPQRNGQLLTAVSLAETETYLQNVLLRDTDQMSMAVALEVREPFLDHHLVEYVLSLRDETKFPHTPKKLLTDSLGDLLPPEIINRPKMGFTLPWKHWLKAEMRSFCETRIEDFARRGLCDPAAVTGLWRRFLEGDPLVSWSRVWHIVVLSHWMDANNIEGGNSQA